MRGCFFEPYRFRVGCRRQSNVSVLEAARSAATSVGKLLYIGEYGGAHPNFTGPTAAAQAFPEAVLRWQVAAAARVVAAWAPRVVRSVAAAPSSVPKPPPPLGTAPLGTAPLGTAPLGTVPLGTAPYERRSRVLTSIWSWACPSHRASMSCIYPHTAGANRTHSRRVGGSSLPTTEVSSLREDDGSDRMLSLLQWAERRLTPGYCSSRSGRHKRGYCVAPAFTAVARSA